MSSQIRGLRVASAVFAIVCLAQLWRLVAQVEIFAGGYRIPLWFSAVAFLLTGTLSIWLAILSNRQQ
jgi:hypothetical protein